MEVAVGEMEEFQLLHREMLVMVAMQHFMVLEVVDQEYVELIVVYHFQTRQLVM